MPKKLDKFEFSARGAHNWAEYLNGDTWQFTQGEDFDCKLGSFRSQAWLAAKRLNCKVRVSVDKEAKTVTLQKVVEDAPKAKPAKAPKTSPKASKPKASQKSTAKAASEPAAA